jgi:SAM-dependent methyltransferase
MHRSALLHARRRARGPLVWTNATALPFFSDFDVVLLCDVIEHADDDVGLLREAGAVLKDTGCVVVTVPAGPELWTRYDDITGHKRRYTRDSLATAMTNAGFALREVHYFNYLPLIAQRLHRWLAGWSDNGPRDPIEVVRDALRVPPQPLNVMFRAMMRREEQLRRLSWMRGGSLVALGSPHNFTTRKRGQSQRPTPLR